MIGWLGRRVAALEAACQAAQHRCVVIVGPDDVAPVDSDDVFIIRIVAAERQSDGSMAEVTS